MPKILVIHGPNLNLLGSREPGIYGDITLDTINQEMAQLAKRESAELECFQSNDEGGIVERIQHAASDGTDFIIINPAAYTHTSVAIRDAFLAVDIPFIEAHLSNVHRREGFRQHSYLSDIAVGVISGLGVKGYELAVDAALNRLAQE